MKTSLLFSMAEEIQKELWIRFPELESKARELSAGHENEFAHLRQVET